MSAKLLEQRRGVRRKIPEGRGILRTRDSATAAAERQVRGAGLAVPASGYDALLPPAMAQRAEDTGVSKATMAATPTFVLAILAGSFIALGALFSTTVAAGSAGVVPYGMGRLLAGLVFSLGLVLVVVGGAELFTGNALIVMAWASRRLSTMRVLRNWAIVFTGNFVGAAITAAIVYLSGQHAFGGGVVGSTALAIARAKVELGFVQAIILGMLCNALVCLAVWLTLSARTTTDRIVAILFPVTAFVAAGFEHSVANMYFIPAALLIKGFAGTEFWTSIGQVAADYDGLTWGTMLYRNLLPVTIGNVIGGVALVAAVYWFVYLGPEAAAGPRHEERKRHEHPVRDRAAGLH